MDRSEVEAYQRHDRRVRIGSWLAVYAIAVGCGLAVVELWSFVVGVILAVVLVLVGFRLHLRWERARWVKRFPELAAPGALRRRYGIPNRL